MDVDGLIEHKGRLLLIERKGVGGQVNGGSTRTFNAFVRYPGHTVIILWWDNPGGERSRPYGVAIDADDRVWFVETGSSPNKFVGFDPATENFFSIVEVDSGA